MAIGLTPSLVGQELSRLLRLCKATQEARFGIGTGIKYSGDGMAQLLDLEAFDGVVLTMVLKTSCAAHPDHPALHHSTFPATR